jgi:hypothetical protein
MGDTVMADTARRWDWGTWANISTVVAAVVAAIAFAWGAKNELDAANAEKHATVMQVVQAQTQLAVEHPDLAVRNPDDRAGLDDPRYVWFAMNALLTADTIYDLVGNEPDWRNAAAILIEQHLSFVLSPDFPCQLFEPSFIHFTQEVTREAAAAQGATVCPGV